MNNLSWYTKKYVNMGNSFTLKHDDAEELVDLYLDKYKYIKTIDDEDHGSYEICCHMLYNTEKKEYIKIYLCIEERVTHVDILQSY